MTFRFSQAIKETKITPYLRRTCFPPTTTYRLPRTSSHSMSPPAAFYHAEFNTLSFKTQQHTTYKPLAPLPHTTDYPESFLIFTAHSLPCIYAESPTFTSHNIPPFPPALPLPSPTFTSHNSYPLHPRLVGCAKHNIKILGLTPSTSSLDNRTTSGPWLAADGYASRCSYPFLICKRRGRGRGSFRLMTCFGIVETFRSGLVLLVWHGWMKRLLSSHTQTRTM